MTNPLPPDHFTPSTRRHGALAGRWAIPVLLIVLVAIVVAAYRFSKQPPKASANGEGGTNQSTPGGGNVRELLELASKAHIGGNFEESLGILQRAVSESPNDQEVRERLAEAYMAMKKPAEAYEQFTEAIRIGPKRPDLDFAAGTMASMAGKPEVAIGHYQAAQEADKADARYPLYAGQIQIKLGQTEAGKASLLRSAMIQPDNAIAWGTLAEIALLENNAHIALQHIAKARKLQPELLKWRLVEARAHKRAGEPEKAILVLQGVSDADSIEPNVLQTLAECYGLLGKPEEAAARYAKACEIKSEDGELAYQAAVWYERAKDLDRAKLYAKRASTLGHASASGLLAKVGG